MNIDILEWNNCPKWHSWLVVYEMSLITYTTFAPPADNDDMDNEIINEELAKWN